MSYRFYMTKDDIKRALKKSERDNRELRDQLHEACGALNRFLRVSPLEISERSRAEFLEAREEALSALKSCGEELVSNERR